MAEPFTLQLHITDACSLRCRHCYRDESHASLPLEALQRIVDDFTAFCQRRRIAGRVTFAGGEPLLRLADLLCLMRQARGAGHQVHLLTNGLLLDDGTIARLREAGCLRAQISIDGDAAAHDALRGPGTFDRSVAALLRLRDAGMHSTISMTLGQWNLHTLADIVALAERCNAKLFVARFVPCGSGAALSDQLLSPRQWKQVMRACRRFMRRHAPGVALRDPLYVPMLESSSPSDPLCVSGCSIGYNGLAVDADGEAYPCRRLPISLGNLQHTPLEEIWQSPLLNKLRDRDQLHGHCGTCRWRWKCGGCRAIAHAVTGDPLAADPQCPRSSRWHRITAPVRLPLLGCR